MNRVDQVYEDDLSIRLQLIAGNDDLNLDTYDLARRRTAPAARLHASRSPRSLAARARVARAFVIGQIIGASGYDIGHLALGQPGGGVANLGVVGRSEQGRRLHRRPDSGG